MSELLNRISSNNLILLCVIMSVIALFLAVTISIELYNNHKRRKRIEELTTPDEEDVQLNIKTCDNVKYVEDDEELEKTKAKIELAKLKERLRKEEEEKKQLLELNLALANNKKNTVTVEKEEVKENKSLEVEEKVVVEPVKEFNPSVEPVEEIEVLGDDLEDQITSYEVQEEADAIISYDELKKAATFGYTDEEMNLYVDEKDAIISIQELERLYKESNEISEVKIEQFDIKRVEDLPAISDEKKFQSTPFISPVHGVGITEESIQLEQTANLEKLNEEIRKTNEFLKTLKELKKNLQ